MSSEKIAMDTMWSNTIKNTLHGMHHHGILSRYGFNSDKILTLETVGQIMERTRERVRQLEVAWTDKVAQNAKFCSDEQHRLFWNFIEKNLPASEQELQSTLLEEGWITKPWSIAGIKLVYSLVPQIQIPFSLYEVKGLQDRLWLNRVNLSKPVNLHAAILKARKESLHTNSEIINKEIILSMLNSHLPKEEHLTFDELNKILELSTTVINLNKDQVMLASIDTRHARFFNTSKTVLKITGPLQADILLDGIKRRYESRSISCPNLDTALILWQHHQDFQVRDTQNPIVALSNEKNIRDLPKAEMAVVEFCKTHGPATRQQIIEKLHTTQLPLASIQTAISFCPALQPIPGTRGYWKIRGDNNDYAIEKEVLKIKNPNNINIQQLDVHEIELKFSVDYRFNGLLYLSSKSGGKLRNRKFDIHNHAGQRIVVSKTGTSWGYLPTFKSVDGNTKNYTLLFNLKSNIVYIVE